MLDDVISPHYPSSVVNVRRNDFVHTKTYTYMSMYIGQGGRGRLSDVIRKKIVIWMDYVVS
jgi:hypothetical protein